MTLFDIIGIQAPYRVDIYKVGTVCLDTITDELAEKIWREGCPYLTPNEAGRKKFYPGQKPITVEKLNIGSNKKTKTKNTSSS